MAENKTKPTGQSVKAFLDDIVDPVRKQDCRTLIKMMGELTGKKPMMWAATMVGFGSRHFKYESGREGDIFAIGFASRKPKLVLYFGCAGGISPQDVKRLGKCTASKACLYIKSLKDIDLAVLRDVLAKTSAA